MKLRARALLSAVCALMLTLPVSGVPTAQTQVSQGNQGLQGGWAVNDQGVINFTHSLSSQFPIMVDAGAGWVRLNFRLGNCFKNWTTRTHCTGADGRTALDVYDQVVQNALDHNLRVVGLFSSESWPGSQTQWTANNAENNTTNNPRRNGDNTYVQEFAQKAVGLVVDRYKGKIDHWEIWTEPNAWTHLDAQGNPAGGSFLYPSNFAWLLKRSHAAVQTAQPTGTLISGGLFGHDPGGLAITVIEEGVPRRVIKRGDFRGTRLERKPGSPAAPDPATASSCPAQVPSGADYLCSTYDMGISRAGWTRPYPLEHIGQTLYIDQGGPTSSPKLNTYLQDVRNAYTAPAYEGSSTTKKSSVQEVGWQTASVTLDVQAQNLQTAYGTFGATVYVARAFWFNVQDVLEAQPSLQYGLVFNVYNPADPATKKPAFGAYQTYAR